jgi:hypothetical protein
MWLRLPARTRPDHLYPATFCGAPFSDILPGQDVRVCDGQLQEVFDDQGATALHSMRIRQPFDFADRTGTLVWDVDAKVNPHSIGHGWWIEVWITEDPAPMPHTELTVVSSYPRRGIGLSFASGGPCESTAEAWGNSLETVFVTNDDLVQSVFDDVGWDTPETRCFRAMDGQLNHFELRLSTDRLELEVTNFDDPDGPRSFVTVESLALPFSRGYVHLEHVQFSAAQDGLEGCEEGVPNTCPTPSQTFRWDNVAFDGPVLPTPRAYDVPEPGNIGPENEGAYVGWPLWDGSDLTVTFPDVDLEGVVAAGLGWTVLGANGQVYEYRLNEGAWHTSVVPDGPEATATLRGYSVALDLGELVVGSNTLDVRAVDPGTIEGVGNIDLTLELEE